jgi:hypothetical protein
VDFEEILKAYAAEMVADEELRIARLVHEAASRVIDEAAAGSAEPRPAGEGGLVSRAEAEREFGIPYAKLRTLERSGQIHARHRGRAVMLRRTELRRVAAAA